MGTPVKLILQVGQQFERLTVLDPETRKNGVRAALCQCSCETPAVLVPVKHLVHGRVRSCGCIKREQTIERNRAAASRGGATTHPLFSHWAAAMNRCYNPAAGNYRWYGGRGISVWEGWYDDPGAFIAYIEENLGSRPPGMSLDRIDNDGNYEPGNLKWSTPAERARNRRSRSPLR